MTDVSVVIPTKDRRDLVQRALRCALGQEGVEVEAIVVDDGSGDGTADALRALGDARVRVIRHEKSQGVARARNAGVDVAAGTWTAFLDDDDLWAPDKLRRQLDELSAAGGSFSYTGTLWLDAHGTVDAIWPAEPAASVAERLREYNVVGGPSSVVAATAAVREAGGFDPRFSVLADWDLWLRLAPLTSPAPVDAPLTGYVVHDGAMHLVDMDRVDRELQTLRALHGPVGGEDLDRWMASSHRDAGRRWRAASAFVALGVRHRRAYEVFRGLGLVLGEPVMRRVAARRDKPVVCHDTPQWVRRVVAPAGPPAA